MADAQTQRKIAKEIVDAADYHPEQKDFTVHPASLEHGLKQRRQTPQTIPARIAAGMENNRMPPSAPASAAVTQSDC